MKLSFRAICSAIKHSNWALYLFLAFAPLYMRPLGFAGPNKPMYARLKGLWGTPFVGAGIAAKGGYEFLLWMYFQKASVGVNDAAAFHHMLFLTHTGAWTFFGFIALLVYGCALLRWAYHLAASAVCRRRGLRLPGYPCCILL